MFRTFKFEDGLTSTCRAAWQIEDGLPQGAVLDFARRLMPHTRPALPRSASTTIVSAESDRTRRFRARPGRSFTAAEREESTSPAALERIAEAAPAFS